MAPAETKGTVIRNEENKYVKIAIVSKFANTKELIFFIFPILANNSQGKFRIGMYLIKTPAKRIANDQRFLPMAKKYNDPSIKVARTTSL